MDVKAQRINAYNQWPASVTFRAEAEFRSRLSEQDGQIPFEPIALVANKAAEYHRCVGHLIDGLDALPDRPDYFFDHCFKLLDLAKTTVAPGGGNRGVMERLPGELLTLDRKSWEAIADELGRAIPRTTVDFLAKRLLEAQLGQGKYAKELKERAEEVMGAKFYSAFCKKYLCDENGQPTGSFQGKLQKAGSLLRLYLSGKPASRKGKASHPDLEFRGKKISAEERMKALLSLLLFTVRNERAHGVVISPFRTSKATMARYESYYFLMLTAYVFALGTLALRFKGNSVASADILAGCKANLAIQARFFNSTRYVVTDAEAEPEAEAEAV